MKTRYNAGNWVKDKFSLKWIQLGEPEETNHDNIVYCAGERYIWQKDIVEKWEPKKGEYCWFYKKNSKVPVFARFERFIETNLGCIEAVSSSVNGTNEEDKIEFGYFYSMEPFNNKLPLSII